MVPGASNLSLCLKSASQPLELQPSGPQSQQQIRSLVFELWSRLNAVQSQLAGMVCTRVGDGNEFCFPVVDCQRKLEDSRHEKVTPNWHKVWCLLLCVVPQTNNRPQDLVAVGE